MEIIHQPKIMQINTVKAGWEHTHSLMAPSADSSLSSIQSNTFPIFGFCRRFRTTVFLSYCAHESSLTFNLDGPRDIYVIALNFYGSTGLPLDLHWSVNAHI